MLYELCIGAVVVIVILPAQPPRTVSGSMPHSATHAGCQMFTLVVNPQLVESPLRPRSRLGEVDLFMQ